MMGGLTFFPHSHIYTCIIILEYVSADASQTHSHTSWNADMSAHALKHYRHIYIYKYINIYTHRESLVHNHELALLAITKINGKNQGGDIPGPPSV